MLNQEGKITFFGFGLANFDARKAWCLWVSLVCWINPMSQIKPHVASMLAKIEGTHGDNLLPALCWCCALPVSPMLQTHCSNMSTL